ncbi:Protein ste16 [Cyphellophora attinorum]|uniref:Protein ste16 n=1 Tax=Cyphellophora attinorum TaxID=1664694 RepID=A0A0N0NN19_9EURO|nr:Protein ste16 [Phialophora attinorum]KPI41008.1 Protein ste16 [Phialophora attinorum]
MASPNDAAGYSVTPTQRVAFKHASRKSDDLSSTWHRPSTKSNRSMSGGTTQLGQPLLGKSALGNGPPGSFSTDLKSATQSRSTTPQNEQPSHRDMPRQSFSSTRPSAGDWTDSTESRQAFVRAQIAKEEKIKMGTEKLKEALMSKNMKQAKDQRLATIEQELGTSNRKLAELRTQLDHETRAQSPTTPPSKRQTSYFRSSPLRSPRLVGREDLDVEGLNEEESPTVVLTETLQALEMEGMPPDYYIERANTLVQLFKKHSTLKYDLAWSVFSLRVQLMLLSDSSDVVAAGYRLTRHAITDRSSLRTIRSLHTDELTVLSLIKKDKAALEREQAVKLVRAFLDVKSGVYELSVAVVRSLVAVAEHNDDTLKDICLLTLAEILTKHPSLLVSAGGMSTLTDALANGSFPTPDGLVAAFLHILDHPRQRQYLSTGREFEAMFAPFTDPMLLNGNEEKLKHCAKAIAAMLKTWPGFLALSERNAMSLHSLIESLQYPITAARGIILDLLIDTLRIKVPYWSDTYVAGRRLTTYGRVNTEAAEPDMKRAPADDRSHGRFDLTYHFSAIVLAVLIRVGLIPSLFNLIKTEEDNALRRRAILVLTEVLRMAQDSLPTTVSANIQVLAPLLSPAQDFLSDSQAGNLEMLYQIESINRTKNKSKRSITEPAHTVEDSSGGPAMAKRSKYSPLIDGDQFRQLITDSQVLQHASYIKWKWDIIMGLVEGPLTNPKRLDEAIKSSKFMKRLTGFYRPFKHRFSDIRNNQFNQRYVRYGCSLFRTLLQTAVGIQFLGESKVLRQIAECLAQVDPQSGLTSTSPQFDRYQMTETLSGGYFAILGTLSSTQEGVNIMEKWHMMDMFYHILGQRDRDDLVRAILGSMDFTLDTHLRVMLSQALTSAFKGIRLFATKLLRRYAVARGIGQPDSSAHWALRLVMTQLYDPDVEVCEVAVKILEEACELQQHLEFVVRCRPALDHLGELGAPLLLRFLATSIGYRYLNGLDYITQEMDDWFLGRNDTYVALVEASLARAYADTAMSKTSFSAPEDIDMGETGLAPAHFYRELARTEEGCKLLRQSGHFYEFSSTLRDFDLEDDDSETLLKVKGSLWAVGNIGSMALGAPFLEEDDVVKSMVRIAEGAAVMSIRGTAVFALGLCSRTLHGVQMLARTNGTRRSIPAATLWSMQTNNHYTSSTTDADPIKARILKLVISMGNSVTYKKIGQDLSVLRHKHPQAFMDVGLFRKTLVLLESHHYRLLARQHILDLFDKSVMRRLVLDEDADSEETESDTN